ncbi:lipid-A-disaccharide synthase [Gammaproteobacteria bacterium]|nr:lipid-A-disaccharide synthase [Gammaproteobacteria bacterium]MDC3239133.1 lipid-A-disaccharide synthase [Gammaproteobacteria bacterium]
MVRSPNFGIVVGEKSGDILGAGLIRELRKIYPEATFVGVAGPEMLALGCESLVPMDRLTVMGFVEPLLRLRELLHIKRRLRERLIADNVSLFIGIDSPDFNLRLAKELKVSGLRTMHYVSPSVWAYRKNRIYKIKAAVDLMLVLFPFEIEVYEKHKIPVRCVGHPLADKIGFEESKETCRTKLGISPEESITSFLPGSRKGEIIRLAPIFLSVISRILKKDPNMRFIIPFSGSESMCLLKKYLSECDISVKNSILLIDDSLAAMSAADLVVLSSGTATLEALLLRRPMIVCYRLAALSFFIASRLVKIPFVALPNLLADREIVPEYIQGALSEDVLFREIEKFYSASGISRELLTVYERIHLSLRLDGSAKAAQAVVSIISAD